MPTPFTHLLYAQRLLDDPAVPVDQRALLNDQRGAYLLGSIVADAQSLAGLKRDYTHYYSFEVPMEDHPWRVMMARYPQLLDVRDPAQRAFVAGYVMHLSMDEIWSLQMTGPEFAQREWDQLIYRQIIPGGESETLAVYGVRLKKTPEELRAILDSPERMHDELWANVTPELTAEVETAMRQHSRAQMITYLSET